MAAFAANSVFCRFALDQAQMDPCSFTLVRLGSGAVCLWFLRPPGFPLLPETRREWAMPVMLATYGSFFSLAYVRLGAGTGAMIIFTTIQAVMLAAGLLAGERPAPTRLLGMGMGLAGLAGLVFPGLDAPSPQGSLLMAGAGISWAIYSILGRHADHPLAATARNFAWSLPVALVFVLAYALVLPVQWAGTDPRGLAAALLSGVLASGAGYVAWYGALKGLSTLQAGMVQISVPVLTAAAGIFFLAEPLTLRFAVASAIILTGLALALVPLKK